MRLGLTAFGGPVGHIAVMRDEFVRRRAWLDDGTFVDLIGAANLIPGGPIGAANAVGAFGLLLRSVGTGWLIAADATIGIIRLLVTPA